MRPTGRAAVVAGALLLLAGGCGDGDENTTGADEAIDLPATSAGPSPTEAAVPSGPPTVLAIVAPATGAEIKGNVVRLDVAGSGIAITPADGDISGRSGHYHVFVDRDTVAPGAVIPVGAGIIHTTDDPIVIPGLTVGPHRLIVVYGDGSHRRLGYTEASTSFTVAGPSVAASAPPNAPAGQPVTITITAEGLPAGAVFHVLVDREPPPAGSARTRRTGRDPDSGDHDRHSRPRSRRTHDLGGGGLGRPDAARPPGHGPGDGHGRLTGNRNRKTVSTRAWGRPGREGCHPAGSERRSPPPAGRTGARPSPTCWPCGA